MNYSNVNVYNDKGKLKLEVDGKEVTNVKEVTIENNYDGIAELRIIILNPQLG